MQIPSEGIGEAGALAVHPYQIFQCLLLVETDDESAAVIRYCVGGRSHPFAETQEYIRLASIYL